jgi:hypothetical protein
VNNREMLRQRAEIGVIARIPGPLRALHYGVLPGAIIPPQGELVQELARPVVLAREDAPGNPGKGLRHPLHGGRMRSEPVRPGDELPRHW